MKRDQCPECGSPVDECSDPKRIHYSFRRVCYSTMEAAAAQAAYDALHEAEPYHDGTFRSWSKTRSTSHPYHFSAGVSIGAADHDLAPDDPFTTERDASPHASVAQETPGEQDETEDPGDGGNHPGA